MHNITPLVGREEIRAFMLSTWKTDLFRRSQEVGGVVADLVERFAAVPRFVFEMDLPDIERGHFVPWFGGIGLRDYQNPAIHDLFWYHEIYHMITFDYDAEVSFEEWQAKMAMNEIRASVNSEALIYFRLPGLRQQSFDKPIWADRFLASSRDFSEADLIMERWRATLFPRDEIEQRIALFQAENKRWADLWSQRWREPEAAMQRLIEGSRTDRQGALERHLDWLRSMHTDPKRPYSFPDEADGFAQIYWQTRTEADVKV